MLLLVDEETLLDSLPPDGSPCLTRLIQVSSPLKNLQDLASDADLSLGQVGPYRVTVLFYLISCYKYFKFNQHRMD